MSITATSPVPHSLAESLHALLSPLFAGRSPQGRLYRGLKDLPDHLLLDIGVDPRDVPVRAEEAGARAEVLWREATAMTFRTSGQDLKAYSGGFAVDLLSNMRFWP